MPPESGLSNFRMATDALLGRIMRDQRPAVMRMEGELGPDAGAASYEADVREHACCEAPSVTRHGRPAPLGESIRALRHEAQPATLLAGVQACWADALGVQIAAQSRPVRDRDGTITVECRTAAWAQELDLLQDELLERLNAALPEPDVSRLRMVVGDNLGNDAL